MSTVGLTSAWFASLLSVLSGYAPTALQQNGGGVRRKYAERSRLYHPQSIVARSMGHNRANLERSIVVTRRL